jgi:hypothetical protein
MPDPCYIWVQAGLSRIFFLVHDAQCQITSEKSATHLPRPVSCNQDFPRVRLEQQLPEGLPADRIS